MDCKTQTWQPVIQTLGSQQEEEPAVKKMEEMFRAWTAWARKGKSQRYVEICLPNFIAGVSPADLDGEVE